MRVLGEETWAWMLFEDETSKYLSVVCGSVGIYDTCFALSEFEVAEFFARGNASLSQLARSVSQHPATFQHRHLQNFRDISGVREAIAAWRKARSVTS